MDIKNITMYRDGGTIEIETTNGIYCIDNRIKTKYKGEIFNGYPKSDNSNIIDNQYQGDIKSKIIESLKKFDDYDKRFGNWELRVKDLLNNK